MAQQLAAKKSDDGVSKKKLSKKMREKRLNIRFSESEFALIESKANGMSLARYARAILTKGSVPRRERDYPKVDPKLLRQLQSIGKNLNQLVRYTHTQANANRPIDTLNLALAIDNMSEQIAQLKKQYQVPENYFSLVDDEDNAIEGIDTAINASIQSSSVEKSNLNKRVTS